MDKKYLEEQLDALVSMHEIARQREVSVTAVRYWVKKHGLSVKKHIKSDMDPEQIRALIPESRSKRDLLHKLGRRDSGSIYTTLNKVCAENGIELPDWGKVTYPDSQRDRDVTRMFSLNSNTKGSTLSRHMQTTFGIVYQCSIAGCGIVKWLGSPLTLEVDHIDGNHKNNQIENLRFLCPNCHGQAPTSNRKKFASVYPLATN